MSAAPFLPYGRHTVDEDDVRAVAEALRSDWLTTGPAVEGFERDLAAATGAAHAVAVNSGTAALHAAYAALGVGPGDEVIVPPLTFAATANAAMFLGARPVFADIDPATLLLDPGAAEAKVTARTKAIVGVDYAGQPCDWDALRGVAERHGLALVADACHALGGASRGRPVGSLADLSCFSFHPVKAITTGEGGAITTSDPALAERMRRFRNHAIGADHRRRAEGNTWYYEVEGLGFNYRLSDVQAALGRSQLRKLPRFIARRRELAERYAKALAGIPAVDPLGVAEGVAHAYHLYVVALDLARLSVDRGRVFRELRAAGIGVNVHYVPVHLHPYHRAALGTGPGLCPVAEGAYERILSLPMFPAMHDDDVHRVAEVLDTVVRRHLR